nr:immunoglobulin light chain junction region [Macaca mulatta]MOW08200.1 immunoglobulin light chain junction region [Macaca mulatta]MOW09385.1 immunoglobulin light chain junction region [Macaca mulatta]MOW10569.1 immunoglobulin light chain junction region [Macaca mulatta]MOW11960.1 immunoglobulin light chain junction region [Macaca mulatta]
CLQYNSIPFTF